MKFKILLLITIVLIAAPVYAQNNDPLAGKKLSYYEKAYRDGALSKVKRANEIVSYMQDLLNACLASDSYSKEKDDCAHRRYELKTYQDKLTEAQEQAALAEQTLITALSNKSARKQLEKELQAAFLAAAREIGSSRPSWMPVYSSSYPSTTTFTIRCRSWGVGRFYSVRCTSTVY